MQISVDQIGRGSVQRRGQRGVLPILVALLFVAMMVGGHEVHAQVQVSTDWADRDRRTDRSEERRSASTTRGVQPGGEVPDWAEARADRDVARDPRAEPTVRPKNPGGGLPGGGNRNVPLGGIGGILVVGLGYGIWRIRTGGKKERELRTTGSDGGGGTPSITTAALSDVSTAPKVDGCRRRTRRPQVRSGRAPLIRNCKEEGRMEDRRWGIVRRHQSGTEAREPIRFACRLE